MSLENVQVEFGTEARLQRLSDAARLQNTAEYDRVPLIDEVNSWQAPVPPPRYRPPLGRTTQFRERIGLQPVQAFLTLDTADPIIIANANRDLVTRDDNDFPPVFIVYEVLRDESAKRTHRLVHWCEGAYAIRMQPLTQQGGGGMQITMECIRAGAWLLGVADDITQDYSVALTTPNEDSATESNTGALTACLWYVDAVSGDYWQNGEKISDNTYRLLGIRPRRA